MELFVAVTTLFQLNDKLINDKLYQNKQNKIPIF